MKKLLVLSLIFGFAALLAVSCGEKEAEKPKTDESEAVTGEQDTDMQADQAEEPAVAPEEESAESEVAGEKETDSDEQKAAPAKTEGVFEGKVVDLAKALRGQAAGVDKKAAQSLLLNGGMIAFQADNGNLYFLFNADGTPATAELAKYAVFSKIGVKGKAKKVKGLNVITVETMNSME